MSTKKFVIPMILLLVVVISGFPPGSTAKTADPFPVLVGLYPSAELYTSIAEINTYNADFGGEVFSLAGTFLDIEAPDWFINSELAAAWNNGYVPFVNLGSGGYGTQHTAEEIANGALDENIRRIANLYEFWAKGLYEDRKAFVAPLQEANGGYAPYSGDPENYHQSLLADPTDLSGKKVSRKIQSAGYMLPTAGIIKLPAIPLNRVIREIRQLTWWPSVPLTGETAGNIQIQKVLNKIL